MSEPTIIGFTALASFWAGWLFHWVRERRKNQKLAAELKEATEKLSKVVKENEL